MKQHIVPTSPKSSERSGTTATSAQNTFIVVIIGMIFGVCGGIVGAIYTHNVLNTLGESGATALFHFSRDTDASAVDMSVARKSLVAVYASTNGERTYDDFVGSATVMSSDGWLVASADGFTNQALTAVLPNGDEAAVQSVVMRSDMRLVFLRIARADLSPASLAQSAPNVGDALIAFQGSFDWEHYSHDVVVERTELPASLSSVVFVPTLHIEGDATSSPLYTESNQSLAGIRSADGSVIPAAWIASAFDRLSLDAKEDLSFSYESLEHYTAAYKKTHAYPAHGWLVTTSADPLEEGDIITAIDGKAVSATMDFASEVAARTSGAFMTVSVLRGGETLNLSIQAW